MPFLPFKPIVIFSLITYHVEIFLVHHLNAFGFGNVFCVPNGAPHDLQLSNCVALLRDEQYSHLIPTCNSYEGFHVPLKA